MDTVSYDLSFSFDQPERVFNALQAFLQQRLNQPQKRMSRETMVRNAHTVLVIDPYEERSHYLTRFLTMLQYRPAVANTPLEAFTHFLQGDVLPFAIVLGQEEDAKHLFLLRLLQQMAQKYDWEPLLIRLHSLQPFPLTIQQPGSTIQQTRQSGPLAAFPSQISPSRSLSQPLQPFNAERHSGPLPGGVDPFAASGIRPLPSDRALLQENSPAKNMKLRISVEGQSLGRYQIGESLGSGPHGDVHKTYDRLREGDCALKAVQTDVIPFYIIEQSNDEVTLFEQEAELLKRFKHPHILPVLNCGKSYVSGSPFIYKTMPYCPDRSLAHWLYHRGRAGSFAVQDVPYVILQLADALQCLHEQQIIYQNFKMSNLLILKASKDLQGMQLALADLLPMRTGLLFPGTADSFLYMSPERWGGIVLPASDQYGLAAITYELLTGRPPFQGNVERTLRLLHTTRQPRLPGELNSVLPPAVNAVLMRALAKKPEERFPSVSSFATTLMRCWG